MELGFAGFSDYQKIFGLMHLNFLDYKWLLPSQDFEDDSVMGLAKDVSDKDWTFSSQHIIQSAPWLIMHLLGTQFVRKYQQKMVPIFHASLSILYLSQFLDLWSNVLILSQLLLIFLVSEVSQMSSAIYVTAIGILFCHRFGKVSSINFSFHLFLKGQSCKSEYLQMVKKCSAFLFFNVIVLLKSGPKQNQSRYKAL